MSSQELAAKIKDVQRGLERAQKRVEARKDALQALRDEWAVALAAEHGVIVGQRRYIRPRKEVSTVEYIYYAEWAAHEELKQVAVGFSYSKVDPVHLKAVTEDSEVVAK